MTNFQCFYLYTGLTLGGFIQPSVAWHLIEIPANIEKGLCQRFLWLVPKPSPVPFEDLQQVDREFFTSLSKLTCSITYAYTSDQILQCAKVI